jgi:hypothetical protein
MRRITYLSLCAGLSIASSAATAADVSTWRWQVSQCLRAQQERDADAARVYHEASAFEVLPDARAAADPLYSGDLKAGPQTQLTGQ